MPKSRVFFLALVAFLGGTAFVSFVTMPLSIPLAFFSAAAICVVSALFQKRFQTDLLIAALCVVLFGVGVFRYQAVEVRAERNKVNIFEGDISFTATIRQEPLRNGKSQQIILTLENKQTDILIIARPYPQYAVGDIIAVSGKLEHPKNFTADFDYAAYLGRRDIFGVIRFPDIEKNGSASASGATILFHIKQLFSGAIRRLIPEPESSFILGILLGERQSLPAGVVVAFQNSGTAHLIALSGYNITIVAAAVQRVFSFFAFPAVLSFGGSVFAIVLFTILTGASASVVRASLMGILVLIAYQSGRMYHVRNALALAGAIMVFWNPHLLRFDIGFQLSFLATVGLVYGAPVFDRWFLRIKERIVMWIRDRGFIPPYRAVSRRDRTSRVPGIFATTVAAQFFVLPLLVYQFGALSLVSPFANVFVLPFIPSTMFFGFCAGALGALIGRFARPIGWIAWALAHGILSVIVFFGALPFAALHTGRVATIAVVLSAFGVLYFLWKQRNAVIS